MGGRGSSKGKNTTLSLSINDRLNYIPDWFYNKNFTSMQKQMIMADSERTIQRETEKAILVKWETDYGNIKQWVPKSLLSDEAINNYRKELGAKRERQEAGMAYNLKLKRLARQNGIRVGPYTRTQTLINKLKEKGIKI